MCYLLTLPSQGYCTCYKNPPWIFVLSLRRSTGSLSETFSHLSIHLSQDSTRESWEPSLVWSGIRAYEVSVCLIRTVQGQLNTPRGFNRYGIFNTIMHSNWTIPANMEEWRGCQTLVGIIMWLHAIYLWYCVKCHVVLYDPIWLD